MHKTIDFQIKGISPLMLHNGQLADPLNPYTKRLKSFTSKRKKTDEDHEAIAKAEWEGGLYLNDDGRVIFPGENLEAALIGGGKKKKLGEDFKAGLLCEGDWLLEYEGPKSVEKLWQDGRFRDTRGAVNPSGGARIMRTRPIFKPWSLKFTVSYLPDILNPDQILESLTAVGRIIGIGDFTPKYGRFMVVS